MSDVLVDLSTARSGLETPIQTERSATRRTLRRRHAAERAFRLAGVAATVLSIAALLLLLGGIAATGWTAFFEPVIRLEIHFAPEVINPDGLPETAALRDADYPRLILASLKQQFPEATGRTELRELKQLVSPGAGFELRDQILDHPEWLGTRRSFDLPFADPAAQWLKRSRSADVTGGVSGASADWLLALEQRGLVHMQFNSRFLVSGDSREPELAGLGGAAIGSLLTLFVTLACSFPIGVGAAIYLEEFARRGRVSDFIEVNINNLAAVPSIVFGLLGLAIFLNYFDLSRSAPLVGGLVLSLMTLPTIIIASRSALKAVPPSIREAALAIGASPVQVVFHHLLPLATPGIMTGAIVGLARALGETAPLLMIGMVAFVADVPSGFASPATVLPVQIYLWSDSPERGFEEKTAGAILVLIALMLLMNAVAIVIRRRFEKSW